MKYNYKEAYCLMNYRCESCGKLEQLWNSRDGVTPFVIPCIECDGEMSHVAWNRDYCCPNFSPLPGMRVFVDMTDEKRKEIAEKRIEAFKGTEYEVPEEKYQSVYDSIIDSMPPGWPMIITAKEYLTSS